MAEQFRANAWTQAVIVTIDFFSLASEKRERQYGYWTYWSAAQPFSFPFIMVGGQQERRGAVMIVSCKDQEVGFGLADFGGDSRVKSSINRPTPTRA
ncbi:hypothetical protein FNAPI_3002 [Fusarium napiforme]|uniref:Uncharacterized protein n=1 Tax=Fusarium napiforme TaxID=42672 RepID=A0A8H5JZA5_9HYPO|nr:hypothetical protein FNAPI_3002 [Fusarium napiforme]